MREHPEPRRERAPRPIEEVGTFPQRDEHLLHHIVGRGRVAEDSSRNSEDRGRELVVDPGEGSLVAGGDAAHQALVAGAGDGHSLHDGGEATHGMRSPIGAVLDHRPAKMFGMRLSTACPLDCPDTCSLEVEVEDGRLISVDTGPANPLTQGFICAKVKHHARHVYAPERVLTPLVRSGPKGEGAFRPASWDEALDLVASRISATIGESGPRRSCRISTTRRPARSPTAA